MLTQYENNRIDYVVIIVIKRQMCHFALWNDSKTTSWWPFRISDFSQIHRCDVSLYLAIFSLNMKTTGFIVWSLWWSKGKIVICFIQNEPLVSHFTNFLHSLPLTYIYLSAKYWNNLSTFATCRAKAKRESSMDAAERWLNHSNIFWSLQLQDTMFYLAFIPNSKYASWAVIGY